MADAECVGSDKTSKRALCCMTSIVWLRARHHHRHWRKQAVDQRRRMACQSKRDHDSICQVSQSRCTRASLRETGAGTGKVTQEQQASREEANRCRRETSHSVAGRRQQNPKRGSSRGGKFQIMRFVRSFPASFQSEDASVSNSRGVCHC